MENVIIYGSKDFAHTLKNLVNICGHKFIGFIDDYEPKRESVLGTFQEVRERYSNKEYKIVNGIGYNSLKARWDIHLNVKNYGYETINLIHPKTIIDRSSVIGNGNIIMAGTIIEMNTLLNDLIVLWPGVVINHDCQIGNNSFFSPNSNVCGFSKVEDNCFIGASAVVVNNTVVPENSFIKAGSVYSKKRGDKS